MLSICVFYYMGNLFAVTVFYGYIVHWSVGEMYPQYMYILLHVKVIWCNGISEIYLLSIGVGGRCILSICAFCSM